jgi:hypothetical protein
MKKSNEEGHKHSIMNEVVHPSCHLVVPVYESAQIKKVMSSEKT